MSKGNMSCSEKELEYREICNRVTLQEKKEGFFFNLAESEGSKLDIELFKTFTTDYERIKFVAAFCWDSISAQLIYRGKKLEEAVKKRKEGNCAFEQGDHSKALLCYCQSIIQAPVGPELVNVYSNRSALLHKMGDYELAITDAELAICYGAPETTRHKLYERMASCYVALKNYHKAKVILRLAKYFAENFDKDNIKFTQKLEKLSKLIQTGEIDKTKFPQESANKESSNNGDKLPNFKPSSKYPNASNKFDVKYSSGLGRYAYAKEKISVGEEILREVPFAACLSVEKMGTHCLHCFKRLKVPIACETCANVAFCSRECKKHGDEYHRYECRVLMLLIGSGMSLNCYLALRIITQSSFEEFKKIIPQLNINSASLPIDSDQKSFDSTSYINIYNLGGLEDQREPEDLLYRSIMSVFLVKCLRLVGYFDVNLYMSPLPTSDELHIGALLLRNLQIVQFNAYEVCEFLMENKTNYQKSSASGIGLALYSTASYFNHSCNPDVTRYFIGSTMIIKATKGIEANRPISDNYGPQFIKMDREERRLKLSGRYWFQCTCDACVNDWPKLIDIAENDPKTPEEGVALKKLLKMEATYFVTAVKAMEMGSPDKAIELLRKYIQESENILLPHKESLRNPHKIVLMAQQALQLCYCSLGAVHYAQK